MTEASPRPLSLAFMRGHPAQAAFVLEQLPPREAAELFARTPARLGAVVLAAMLPQRAGQCLQALDDPRALELLAPMGTQATVALLRQLPAGRRQQLLKGLPTATALATTLLLGHGQDTLGAWADPDVLLLGAQRRACEALAQVRETSPLHPLIFVASADRRLQGTVSLAELLRAPDNATLGSLAQMPQQVLSAQTPLAGAEDHPAWSQASLLPVLESGQRLVGVLSHDALRRAQRMATPATPAAAAAATLPALLAQSYWQSLSGLIDAGLALLPRVGAVQACEAAATGSRASPNSGLNSVPTSGPQSDEKNRASEATRGERR